MLNAYFSLFFLFAQAPGPARPAQISMASQDKLIRGKVLQEDGSPREGAEVLFLSEKPLPLSFLRVRTGPKGKFRIQVPANRSYLAWSHFKEKSGWNQYSLFHTSVGGGSSIILREVGGRPETWVQVKQRAPWARDLLIQWRLGTHRSLKILSPLDPKGRAKVPDFWPRQGGSRPLDIHPTLTLLVVLDPASKRGLFHSLLPLEIHPRPRSEASGKNAIQGKTLATTLPKTLSLRFPKFRQFRFKIHPPFSKEEKTKLTFRIGISPVPKPPFSLDMLPFWFALSTQPTPQKQDQEWETRIPLQKGKRSILLIERKGFQPTQVTIAGDQIQVDGKQVHPKQAKEEPTTLSLSFEKEKALPLFLWDRQGKPIHNAQIHESFYFDPWKSPSSSYLVGGPSQVLHFPPKKPMLIGGLPKTLRELTLVIEIPQAPLVALLPKDFKGPPPKTEVLAFRSMFTIHQQPSLNFSLQNHRILRIQIQKPDGSPAPFPIFSYAPKIKASWAYQARGNARGQATLVVPNTKICLHGSVPGEACWFHLDWDPKTAQDHPNLTILSKAPQATFQGRVFTPQGTPVPFAVLRLLSFSNPPQAEEETHGEEIKYLYAFFYLQADREGRFHQPIQDPKGTTYQILLAKGSKSTRVSLKDFSSPHKLILK